MEDFQSKYSGEQVEAILDSVANGGAGGSGGITVEIDPIFSASPASRITDNDISNWNGKADASALESFATKDYVASAIAESITNVLNTEV